MIVDYTNTGAVQANISFDRLCPKKAGIKAAS
jgi:hypothetical protein